MQFFQNKAKLLLLFFGAASWVVVMIKSGLLGKYGLGFWGPNGHDGVWHIALANSFARGSFEMPTFAGSILQNYHIGFDLILASLHRLTSIPTSFLYFQVLPILISLGIGMLVYKFVVNWTKSKSAAAWSLFFVFFGGSWGWVLGKGESAFWSQQAVSTLINPPFALSLLLMTLGLIMLQKKKNLLAIIIFGSLIQIKAYAGVLALGGLLVAGVWDYMKQKNYDYLKVFLGAFIISVLLYLPFNKASVDLLVFKPFWFLETMMQLSDRVGWVRFGEAMVNYKLGNNWLKAIPAYSVAFLIFWFGNMGTRFIKELWVIKSLKNFKKLSSTEVFIVSVVLAGGIIPMFFLQKGTPWNTIQFFYYSLFFSGILAGVSMTRLKNKVLAAAVVLLTLPTTYITLKNNYLPGRPPAKLSIAEVEALKFLSNQDNGVVLTYPFDKSEAEAAISNPPRPLYLYETTAYVSAFGDKPVFLEDEVNLNITGYDWPERRQQVESFLNENDQQKTRSFLKENNIEYVYWVKPQRALLGEDQLGITKIFENGEINIYKVI